jgi:hypothetical protein
MGISIEKLRSYRIFGIALFDLTLGLIGTIIVFIILWKVHFPTLSPWKFVLWAVLLTIPIGMFVHLLFGVNTTLNYRAGLSYKPS